MNGPDRSMIERQVSKLHALLRLHGCDPRKHFLDQLPILPKELLFELSHEAISAELDETASGFEVVASCEATTLSGRALSECVGENLRELGSQSAFDFCRTFVTRYLSRALCGAELTALKFRLYSDVIFELADPAAAALQQIRALWLLDPRNGASPAKAGASTYRHLDHASIWSYWSRQLTHPFYIDTGRGNHRLGSGYVYDLRRMAGFTPPMDDLAPVIRSLLQEADLLRSGSIPARAYVEINFPPFTMLVFEEVDPAFVMIEALDVHGRVLPIYLFPSSLRWSIPETGCGPDGTVATFKTVATVLVSMAAAALRDFWVVEDRDRILGPPRIARLPGSRRAERRVVYLPRIRYVGGREFGPVVERAANINARAAHWRSEHYRKLPDGQRPTLRQTALAEAFNRHPPEGSTWVRGTSIAGAEAERVYRSRSLARLLFDVVPSKARALVDLSWFEFERHCGRWLGSNGFDEVARASIDRGVDITAIKGSDAPQKWVIQCKHWTKRIGPDVVRELEGARALRNADRAMLIASSAFTRGAIDTATELGIDLVDGDGLGLIKGLPAYKTG